MRRKMRRYPTRKKNTKTAKRFFIVVLIIIVALLILLRILDVKVPFFPNTGGTQYVSASGTKLYVNGEQYQFTGINAFNLGTYAGVNAGCGGQESNLDALFAKLRPNSMVRAWAFQGTITTNSTNKQTDWSGLDRVVNAASKNGVKLILVLGEQSGTCDDGHWKDKAWYEGGYKQAFNDSGNGLTPLPYLDYVKLVVARYKDSPTIAMWEPINEPEAANCTSGKGSVCYANQSCTDETGARNALRSFFDDVGAQIKSIDPNHLVSSGVIGGGQCGAVFEDYKYVHESSGIDVASYHDYGSNDQPMPGDAYNGLQKRLNQMKLINKPLIVGEVGMQAMDNTGSCLSLSSRRDKLKEKMDAQFQAGIAGFMPWALSSGVSTTCNYDIGDNDPTLTLLHDYSVLMSPIGATPSGIFTTTPYFFPTPTPDRQAPTIPTMLIAVFPTQVTLSWVASNDNVGVVRYDIFRDDKYFTSTTATSFTNSNLTPGTTYTYHIKGKDAAGNNSGSSNRVTITTPLNQPTQ